MNLLCKTRGVKRNVAKKKQKIRVVYRAIGFLGIVAGAFIIKLFPYVTHSEKRKNVQLELNDIYTTRLLTNTTETTSECKKNVVDDKSILIFYVTGVLYMFVAIAIVCDELFVPALEEIASENYLNLSMDVAGATLMAAGGSAPELFTSLVGTFQESEVGFGTIIGSAVFNIMFVIGMCAITSKDVLVLTWWPLARDCTYYSFGLLLLALFCGFSSPGQIELWEACILLCLYLGYVLIMKYNSKIWTQIDKRLKSVKIVSENTVKERKVSNVLTVHKSSVFRAGLLDLFMGRGSLLDRMGIAMVTKISGDVGTVFKKLDESGDGFIDTTELCHLFQSLGTPFSKEDVSKALLELDENSDGKIDFKEFTKWYIKSEARLKIELRNAFDSFDIDNLGTINANLLLDLMKELGTAVKEEDVQEMLAEIRIDGPTNKINCEEFEDWYTHSKYWDELISKVDICSDEVIEPFSDNLKPPKEGNIIIRYAKWIFLLPIVCVLCLTVPDVRQPGNSKLCFLSFLLSIFWIGGFTYYMVQWADEIGSILGIPMGLMGLTLLAAGTSVPDLLTSVIVARMGEGDMAVSSSIGSNIFDITVGLPVPWLLYCLMNYGEKTVVIKTKGMSLSIIILFAMLVTVVLMVHISGWKLTKLLGSGMLLLYILYLTFAIIREIPFESC